MKKISIKKSSPVSRWDRDRDSRVDARKDESHLSMNSRWAALCIHCSSSWALTTWIKLPNACNKRYPFKHDHLPWAQNECSYSCTRSLHELDTRWLWALHSSSEACLPCFVSFTFTSLHYLHSSFECLDYATHSLCNFTPRAVWEHHRLCVLHTVCLY